jgi:hypothetical protein
MDGSWKCPQLFRPKSQPPHMLNAMREFVPPQAQSFVAFNRECPKSASSR